MEMFYSFSIGALCALAFALAVGRTI